MEALIDIVNQLQDIYAASKSDNIDLPQIVVVGSQSSGKSSVLEHIVGRSFLPRGAGVVTRCPLILQLVHSSEDTVDCAIFNHRPKKSFTDYKLIREEIEAETERLAGANKNIRNIPINLKMFSNSFLNLTLIDLPGIVKVAVEDQPKDIEMQVRNLVLGYIVKPNCLILAVTPANTDMVNSESLKIAAEVDPAGERTLAVITKLDLMDEGTDAWNMLQGKVIPVKLGIIGVVNRSQKDINDEKSIKESLKNEKKFLMNNYPRLASKHGSDYLSKTVQGLLIGHIKTCLPDLNTKILNRLAKIRVELSQIEEHTNDKSSILLDLLSDFSRAYVSAIKGELTDIETDKIYGGARINYIFRTFSKSVNGIEALAGLTESHILTALQNASGVTRAIFVPEVAFELLVKKQIEIFRNPSLTCIELVLAEMKTIVQSCTEDERLGLQRYSNLKTELNATMIKILQEFIPKSKEMVTSFINVQLARINTDHEEFFPNLNNTLTMTAASVNHPGQLHINLPKGTAVSYDKSSFDLNLIQTLIKSYFAIVRKTIQDTIPKIIMYCLVNTVMERLERELVSRLGGQADELLAETQSVVAKREALKKEIEKLERVQRDLYSLSSSVVDNIIGLNL